MFWKLFVAFGTLVVASLVALLALLLHQMNEEVRQHADSLAVVRLELMAPVISNSIASNSQSAILASLEELAKQSSGRCEIYSSDATLLAAAGPKLQAIPTDTLANLLIAARKDGTAELRQARQSGVDPILHARRLTAPEGSPAILLSATPIDRTSSAGAGTMRFVFRASAGVAAVALALTAVFAWRYSVRLQHLSNIANKIASGDYDRSIDFSSEDEVGNLAGSVHQMRQELRQQIHDLDQVRRDLQTMLETIPESVLAIDVQQRILFANPSTNALFGLPVGDLVGQKLWAIVRHPQLHEAIMHALSKTEPYQTEFEILNPPKTLAFRGRSLTVKSGRAIVVVLHDVTALRRLERLRQDFIANVSHELKTPLASIKAFTETLLEPDVDDRETVRKFLTRIDEQADRLHALVLDMLTLARVESEEQTFDIQVQDVHEHIEEGERRHGRAAAAKSIQLSTHLSPEARYTLADHEGLMTLLNNLIDNAIKYTPEGGRVRISTYRQEEKLQISVEDTGVGIPQEDLRRVFERFYRVDKARSREMGGTGLGLAIVKHLAQRFGGTVSVTSRLRHGSTFTVTLPLITQSQTEMVAAKSRT